MPRFSACLLISRCASRGLTGEFGGDNWPRWGECSGGKGDAQNHVVAIGHKYLTWAVRRRTPCNQRKPASKERVPRVDDLNVFSQIFFRVLEPGS